MTTPIATTESPKHQLEIDFERMAHRSFELCLQALMKVDFYAGLLRRLEAGQSIEDELPVVASMSPEVVSTEQMLFSTAAFQIAPLFLQYERFQISVDLQKWS